MLTRALDRIENTHIDQDPETYHRVVKGLKQQRPPGAAVEAKKQAPNSFKRLLAIQKQITNGGPNTDAYPDVFHKYGAEKVFLTIFPQALIRGCSSGPTATR